MKTITSIQLKCKNCDRTLLIEKNKDILFCPYCGSKELIIESDAVKIQKIKLQTYKEIELEKQKIELMPKQKLKPVPKGSHFCGKG